MDLGAPGTSGLLGSLRGLADGVFGSFHDRLELLSIELQEEKQRLVQMLGWLAALALFVTMALLFASCALVVAFWDTPARLPIIGGLALVYAAGAVFTGVRLRRFMTRSPRPLAATINELEVDRECVRPKS